ncbi:uncharacterized protein BCR38DRAFT_460001 [Pseudomassariella vexata]|uniref:TLC domain-containing protein n=1 Tax=Pseudomassariella vexata TaxID=1141098 RepID=A0A1Y2DL38_9PEZI|nr:uncharacterized protein BCR38DRAFT_460001 [Pseudomassariella vexata]ORY60018.1 hypothetical protein BCR38DRAFT_460001 [Pseudomassariella vexata]
MDLIQGREAERKSTSNNHTKIDRIENESISALLSHASLVLVCASIAIILLVNLLERFALRKLWRGVWTELELHGEERRRRSFTYHHVAALVMFLLLCFALYPVYLFLISPESGLSTPIMEHNSKIVTAGDVLLTLSQIYCAYYIFELGFRTQFMSIIGLAHHVGLLLITQTALVISVNMDKDATIEYYMCIMWGTFDLIAEFPIHTCMIYWRVRRNSHRTLMYIAYSCYAWQASLAAAETALTIYLLNASWDRWEVKWQVITPLIFALWISTQIYGATTLLRMGHTERRHCTPIAEERTEEGLPGTITGREPKSEEP